MKIPCKDCLILPVCKQRTTVQCDWLSEEGSKSGDEDSVVWWKRVSEYLPITVIIRDSKGKICQYHVKIV